MGSAEDGRVALMLLSDGRFPSGAHALSTGMEEAVASGQVRDLAGVAAWAEGVLWTGGLTAAGLAASACHLAGLTGRRHRRVAWADLDAEADARTPSPAQRATTRRAGRQLLRTATQVWPSELLDDLGRWWPDGLHRPVTLGAVTAMAGGRPFEAALAEAYGALTIPSTAALRLLNLDPVAVTVVMARLAPALHEVAEAAAGLAAGPPGHLPARSAPMVDLYAEGHAAREGTLFAS